MCQFRHYDQFAEWSSFTQSVHPELGYGAPSLSLYILN